MLVIFVLEVCSEGTCIQVFYINCACISGFDIVKHLEIHFWSSQISKMRLFETVLENKLGANWYRICF